MGLDADSMGAYRDNATVSPLNPLRSSFVPGPREMPSLGFRV